MEKYISRTIIVALILGSVCFVTYKFYNVTNVKETQVSNVKQNNMLSMMLETEANSGTYETATSNSWPSDEYVFNNKLSKCENGGILSWDDTNKKVVFEGNNIDKCYVYFDVYSPQTLIDYVKSQYTGTQGTNGIYYHTSSLANSAADNSYRFAGKNPNNYICFGSEESACPEDNLYRIIGVFGVNNHGVTGQQLVKVIKNKSYGNYQFDTSGSSKWATASINNTINNTFLNDELSTYKNTIINVSWKVSGYSDSSGSQITPKLFYAAEVANSTLNYSGKIGLMYASDYGFSADAKYWTYSMQTSGSTANYSESTSDNWLYTGETEWTISGDSSDTDYAWYVYKDGTIGCGAYVADVYYATRPVFFLDSSLMYLKGNGTSDDPIRIDITS